MIDTNFPLKVVCPDCNAAITVRCKERIKPRNPDGTNPFAPYERFVDWFHFSRIEKAKLLGFDDAA